jgi:hypothetical protein
MDMTITSKFLLVVAVLGLSRTSVVSFAPSSSRLITRASHTSSALQANPVVSHAEASRADFLTAMAINTLGLSVLSSSGLFVEPALARGRPTLDLSYDRYTPRIIAGGQFFANDLRKLIEKNDWAGLKAATSDPPKKTKADRSKMDGGIAERAAQAGGFSAARVLNACQLFAAAFSDNSISPKTKKMQQETEKIKEVIEGINLAAREGLGEESGGGLFGLGAKKPSQAELAKRVRQLYIEGGNAWNQYIFAANEELPISLKKLPYLK